MASDESCWQAGQPLAECLTHMLENKINCDVTFEFQSLDGSISHLSAHKFMLIARSPVFQPMFGGNFVESTGKVEISDIESSIFMHVLRYMYTDRVDLTASNVVQIVYASKKYMLQGLLNKCTEFIEKELNDNDVCTVLSGSIDTKEDDLVEKCLYSMSPRISSVCKTEGFNEMSQEALLQLLQCDTLFTESEVELYQASLTWAKKKLANEDATDDQIRSVLDTCIYQIRFSLMTPEEFAQNVGHSQILKGDEKSLFYGVKLSDVEKYHTGIAELGFNQAHRARTCERLKSFQSHSVPTKLKVEWEIFSFKPNKPITLLGFCILLGNHKMKSVIEYSINYYEEYPSYWHTQNLRQHKSDNAKSISLTCDGTFRPFPVYLGQPLDVSADKWTEVRVSMKGPTGYCTDYESSVRGADITFNARRCVFQSLNPKNTTPGICGRISSIICLHDT